MLPETSEQTKLQGTPKIEKVFVKDLHEKQTVHSCFLVREKAVLTGRNGKPYLSMILSDSSGSVDARVWDKVEATSALFGIGDVIDIKGQVQIFQNRKQIIVHRLERAPSDNYDRNQFLSQAQRDPEEMYSELLQVAEKMSNVHVRQLTIDVLKDSDVRERLLLAPAAKSIHHAKVGGLLEHILSICGLMTVLSTHYKNQSIHLNSDLLLFGAIFHDIGKVWELEVSDGITYSDRGKLIGHITMAIELVEKKASRIMGFPEELKDVLKHVILSHHGRLEYGSPKLPMFLEAFIVAAVDDLDSKVSSIDEFVRGESQAGEKWSRFHPLYERHFLLKLPTGEGD